mmetsp:Transcript_26805/g.63584  ORF Transcript_26805/g.63584 Transcript_26805/m.63584 type:complete len:162 (-) Transcript_26805:159-644(-)
MSCNLPVGKFYLSNLECLSCCLRPFSPPACASYGKGEARCADIEPLTTGIARAIFQQMTVLWAFTLPLAFGGVQIAAELAGADAADLQPDEQALAAAAAQALELTACAWLLGPEPLRRLRPTAADAAWGFVGGAASVAAIGIVVAAIAVLLPTHGPPSARA